MNKENKSYNPEKAIFLSVFFGWLWLDRFYKKNYLLWVVKLFTFWLWWILYIYDIYTLYKDHPKEFKEFLDSKKFKSLFKIIISWLWLFILFWIILNIVDPEKELNIETKPVIENTEIFEENMKIEWTTKHIKKLFINWKEVSIDWNYFSYNLPLEIWENNIVITWDWKELYTNKVSKTTPLKYSLEKIEKFKDEEYFKKFWTLEEIRAEIKILWDNFKLVENSEEVKNYKEVDIIWEFKKWFEKLQIQEANTIVHEARQIHSDLLNKESIEEFEKFIEKNNLQIEEFKKNPVIKDNKERDIIWDLEFVNKTSRNIIKTLKYKEEQKILEEELERNKTTICNLAHSEFEKYLFAPNTADFESCSFSLYNVSKDWKYSFRSSVTSQNAFWVPVKISFYCEVRITWDWKWTAKCEH